MKRAIDVLYDEFIDGDVTTYMDSEMLRDYRMAYDSDDENQKYGHDAVVTIEQIISQTAFKAGFRAAVELFYQK